jgi:hypothetical protein
MDRQRGGEESVHERQIVKQNEREQEKMHTHIHVLDHSNCESVTYMLERDRHTHTHLCMPAYLLNDLFYFLLGSH